jgi:hypothetical protein
METLTVISLHLTKEILCQPAPADYFLEEGGAGVMEKFSDQSAAMYAGHEKRLKRRFAVEQDVRYKMLYGQRIAETGVGRTTNISSSGIWFSTSSPLTVGMPIEISMNWPVLLNDSCPMKLMIYGCVVRAHSSGAAVAIERYEFRTQGSRSFQQPVAHQAAEMRLQS